jgi:two-component system, NarL family, sensor kinase
MREISITEKLILAYVIIFVFVIILVSGISYYSSKEALMERTVEQLNSVRLEKKNVIERFFLDRFRDIDYLSHSTQIQKLAENISPENSVRFQGYADSDFTNYLRAFLQGNRYYNSMIISDGKFSLISTFNTNDSLFGFYVSNLGALNLEIMMSKLKSSNEIVIQDYTIAKADSTPRMYIGTAMKLERTSNRQFFVIFEISIDVINSLMYNTNPHNGLGKSGEAYLVGNDYLMRSRSRFHDNSVFYTKVKTIATEQAFDNRLGSDVIDDYRNIRVISSYGKLNLIGLNWIVLAEIDEEEAMVPIDKLRYRLIFYAVFILALVFVIIYFISLKITKPIRKLTIAAQKMDEGNYDVYVDNKSGDEIESLSSAFNQMAATIKKQTEEIEQQRKNSVKSVIDAQEKERQRLSRELHDGVGQMLSAVNMRLERAQNVTKDDSVEILKTTQIMVKNIISEIRETSNDLMPGLLSELGLCSAIQNLCDELNNLNQASFEFKTNTAKKMVDKQSIYIYRIVQEAINNIVKHSEATKILVDLIYSEHSVEISIQDNGIGFDAGIEKRGNGLMNMKDRAELIGATFNIDTSPGKGTKIMIRIPTKHEK